MSEMQQPYNGANRNGNVVVNNAKNSWGKPWTYACAAAVGGAVAGVAGFIVGKKKGEKKILAALEKLGIELPKDKAEKK